MADRLVVAVKPLLGAVGVEPRGWVICGVVRSINRERASGRNCMDRLKPSGHACVRGSWWTGGQEPGDGTMPSTGLCRVDIAECMSGLVEAVDVLAGSAYS